MTTVEVAELSFREAMAAGEWRAVAALVRAMRERPRAPDRWTPDQLAAALQGVVPRWDDDGRPAEQGASDSRPRARRGTQAAISARATSVKRS